MKSSLLNQLTGEEFLDLLPFPAAEGREEKTLRPLAEKLKFQDSEVEPALDILFSDLRDGEHFVHTEAVMVLLIALRDSSKEIFNDLAKSLSESSAAELGQLRRFARRLKDKK